MLRYLDRLDPTKTNWTPAQLFLTPIMGALFLIFLPFIGFYLVGEMIVQRAMQLFVVSPVPAPGTAYLTGSEPVVKRDKDPQDIKLFVLEKEIAEKRKS